MSWLTKQFKSFKKTFIPSEIRKPFTWAGEHVVPEEITGFYDDAMKGSAQLANKMGLGGALDPLGIPDPDAPPKPPPVTAPQADNTDTLAARDRLRRQVYRAQGRSSTVRVPSLASQYNGQPKTLLGS